MSLSGTNYFALLNVCGCCGKPEQQWHICKSFRTFRAWTFDGPLDHQITEAQHWWPILRDPRITIRDEYGTNIPDVEAFIKECQRVGPRHLHEDERHTMHLHDPQGFILYNGDFF